MSYVYEGLHKERRMCFLYKMLNILYVKSFLILLLSMIIFIVNVQSMTSENGQQAPVSKIF